MKDVMILTGAGQIGMAIARRMSYGMKIVVGDKKPENAPAIAKIMNDAGFDVVPVEMDLSSRESIMSLIAEAQKYGEISMLVNAAGVSPSQAPIEAILKVDLYGTAVLLEEVGKVIKKGGVGVTISSQSGWRMPALTAEEDELLATTPAEDLLQLPMLQPENIRDTLHAYQIAKVKCGNCGRAMPMKSGVVRGVDYRYFYCQHATVQIGEGGCTKEFMREDILNEIVWDSVKGLLTAAADAKKRIGKKKAAAEKSSAGTVKKLADLQKKKAKCESDRFTNMDQFMAGNLDKEAYQKRRVELTKEVGRLDGLIAGLEAKLREMETVQDEGTKALMETAERFSGAKELDQKMVDALIEKVLVYDPEHVEIRWKFSDEVMKLLKE